jgi:hypothetical protein
MEALSSGERCLIPFPFEWGAISWNCQIPFFDRGSGLLWRLQRLEAVSCSIVAWLFFYLCGGIFKRRQLKPTILIWNIASKCVNGANFCADTVIVCYVVIVIMIHFLRTADITPWSGFCCVCVVVVLPVLVHPPLNPRHFLGCNMQLQSKTVPIRLRIRIRLVLFPTTQLH